MRHTFATLSLKSGVDVRTLSETLGHFSAGFTLSTYVHSTPGMKQSAADAIGNTIRNAIWSRKPKRRLQLAAAVQTFKIFLKTEKLVLFCQINLDKSTMFSRKLYPKKWTRK